MSGLRFLFSNGILSHSLDAPPVKVFLEAHPGAYTTSRTHDNGSYLLFWERHMKRLSQSIRILSNSAPQLLFGSNNSANLLPLSSTLPVWQPAVQMLVNDSVGKVLPIALKERIDCEELAITTLVSGNLEELNACETVSEEKVTKFLDVHVHVESYVPPEFGIRGNGAHLAVVAYGRHVAAAKYSDWVRIRKTLEKLRPPSVTELLLSNNGDQILEGCLTNFFVVCCKVYQDKAMKHKERYRAEMEDYREKQKMDQVISDVVPLQLILPEPDTEMLDEAEEDSPQTPEESSSGGSDFRDEFDTNVLPVIGVGAESNCLDSEEKSSKGSL